MIRRSVMIFIAADLRGYFLSWVLLLIQLPLTASMDDSVIRVAAAAVVAAVEAEAETAEVISSAREIYQK